MATKKRETIATNEWGQETAGRVNQIRVLKALLFKSCEWPLDHSTNIPILSIFVLPHSAQLDQGGSSWSISPRRCSTVGRESASAELNPVESKDTNQMLPSTRNVRVRY